MKKTENVFLSHMLRPAMPTYGGRDLFTLQPDKELAGGDSVNSLKVAFSNHIGTHIDFPSHFIAGGKTLNDYQADDFIFCHPALVYLPLNEGRYITSADLAGLPVDLSADILLIKTGYGRFYGQDKYWNDNPGLDSSVADYLKSQYPAIKCIGLDFMSVNAWKDREPGRKAHRAFLSPPEILIIEDMNMSPLTGQSAELQGVTAAPLRLEKADGAPATVIGRLLTK